MSSLHLESGSCQRSIYPEAFAPLQFRGSRLELLTAMAASVEAENESRGAPVSCPAPRAVFPRSTAKTTKWRVLVIEDHEDMAQLIKMHLVEDLPSDVTTASDGSTGLADALSGDYDLVVLDLWLPDVDGLTVCREIRATDDSVPILVVTGRASEADRVVGLELGADDYLTKPFHVGELVARVRALLRRAKMNVIPGDQFRSGVLRVRDVSIDPSTRRVVVAGREITLTPKEFALLHLLASHPGRVFSRAQLLESVWHTGYSGYGHTVDCHVNRLREKLAAPHSEDPRYIAAVWGVGYKFAD